MSFSTVKTQEPKKDLIVSKPITEPLNARAVTEKKVLGFSYHVGGYKLNASIGCGASGVVRRGTDAEHNPVAVKVFTIKHSDGSKSQRSSKTATISMDRIQNEIISLKRCQGHPNILGIKECMQTDDKVYMVTEIAHSDMFDYVYNKGRFPVEMARPIFRQVVSAVSHMHKSGIGHRDIKPENILLTSDLTAKLCDFGYAAPWAVGEDKLPGTMGTVRCLPPEMIRRKGEPMPVHNPFAADMWSCGIVLFFMLTGAFPFEADTDVKTLNNILKLNFCKRPKYVTDDAWALIQRMLCYDADDRPSPQDVLSDPFLCGRRPSMSM